MLDDTLMRNLKAAFAAAVQRIRIPSIGRTFTFRESSVMEHKAFAKTVITNVDSPSVVYAATLSMMRNLCLDTDFDPHSMTEFDRLKVMVQLFSNNFFSRSMTVKCPRKACGGRVKYDVRYGELLRMMDSVDCSDIVFENDNAVGRTRVVANFPRVSRYLSLLESVDSAKEGRSASEDGKRYSALDASFAPPSEQSNAGTETFEDRIRRRRDILRGKVSKAVEEKREVFGNVDLKAPSDGSALLDVADIYINRIQISSIAGSRDEFDIDMTGFDYGETEKVLSSLPMGLFVTESGDNVVKKITRGIFSKMNACVPRIVCPECGFEISKRMTLPNFFIFG